MTTPAPKTPPSPTPWKCNPVPSTGTAGIVTGDGRLVGVVDIADGPRIVLAVNEHEGLREVALRLVDRGHSGNCSHYRRPLSDDCSCGVTKARAILARIEGASRG